jgi:hypothetical protein
MLADVTGAADVAAANTAYNVFCYGKAEPLDTDELDIKCDGLGFGCVSLEQRQLVLDALGVTSAPANTPAATRAWQKARLRTAPTQASFL